MDGRRPPGAVLGFFAAGMALVTTTDFLTLAEGAVCGRLVPGEAAAAAGDADEPPPLSAFFARIFS